MTLEIVTDLYGNGNWATLRVLDAAAGLPAEEWQAAGDGTARSVRETLAHLVGTQFSWLSWWRGSLRPEEAWALHLDPAGFPDADSLRATWLDVSAATSAFLATLGEDDLARVHESTGPGGQPFRMELGRMLLHVANHGTQHRSEAAAMLTAAGHSPGALDMLWWFLG